MVRADGRRARLPGRGRPALPGGAEGRSSAEQRQLAEAMVQQIALAADRARLVADLETTRVESETERLRTALLSSVSHDLRSPLASVIGAASSLSAYGETMPAADRRELLGSIRSEGERLDRYIQNLLDMTRLGSGGLKLQRDWVGVEEMLGSAVGRLRKLFPAVQVETRLAAELPLLYVHPALIEQALFNMLENAAKFSPPGAPVWRPRSERRRQAGGRDHRPRARHSGRGAAADLRHVLQRRAAAIAARAAPASGSPSCAAWSAPTAAGSRRCPGPDGVGTTIRVTLPLPEAPPARSRATTTMTGATTARRRASWSSTTSRRSAGSSRSACARRATPSPRRRPGARGSSGWPLAAPIWWCSISGFPTWTATRCCASCASGRGCR